MKRKPSSAPLRIEMEPVSDEVVAGRRSRAGKPLERKAVFTRSGAGKTIGQAAAMAVLDPPVDGGVEIDPPVADPKGDPRDEAG